MDHHFWAPLLSGIFFFPTSTSQTSKRSRWKRKWSASCHQRRGFQQYRPSASVGSLTKHTDICRKATWTPTNYFPLLIPQLYLEVKKLHWLVWVLSQCCELSAFIYLLNLLYSSSSKWVTLAFFVLSTATSLHFNNLLLHFLTLCLPPLLQGTALVFQQGFDRRILVLLQLCAWHTDTGAASRTSNSSLNLVPHLWISSFPCLFTTILRDILDIAVFKN